MVELLPGLPPALLHNAQIDHRTVRQSTSNLNLAYETLVKNRLPSRKTS